MKRLSLLILALALAGANFYLGLIIFERPVDRVTEKIACVSYDLRYRFQNLTPRQLQHKPTIPISWIERDIEAIAAISPCVRIYYATGGLERVPEIAIKHSMSVVLGADISSDEALNSKEIESSIVLANRFPNIKYLIVGNEVVLHNYLGDRPFVPLSTLYKWIERVRGQTRVPVSTAEPLNSFLLIPDLVHHIDFFSINALPYWAFTDVRRTTEFYTSIIEQARQIDPRKSIFLSEVGWPTAGPRNGPAVPGYAQADEFLRRFMGWATKKKVEYNLFEAFDQRWKINHHEGRVGAQWGLFDASGATKDTQSHLPYVWNMLSCAAACVLCLYLILTRRSLRFGTALYFFSWTQAFVMAAVAMIAIGVNQYLASSVIFFSFVAIPSAVLTLLAWFGIIESQEVLDRHDLFPTPAPRSAVPIARELPFVSIHVPCCREPPDLVIATLTSLLKLQYPRFEIIVMDNNTSDPDFYLPIARFCQLHPMKIRFFHEDALEGYKSGALNFSLRETNQDTDIVAVVDSDYCVEPNWLQDLVPYFEDPSIAVVQAPQAYRDWQESTFHTSLRDEYEGFFRIGMNVRNARNAIIRHGTMILIRRSVLRQVGGWAEWCITEDTELGLRILMAGYRALYVPRVYGRGKLPASVNAYMTQRFRWVYGAMSITIRYFPELCGLRAGLSASQRGCFIRGWLPWLVDATVPFFSVLGFCGGLFWLRSNLSFPPTAFAFPFILFFVFRFCTSVITYQARVNIGLRRTILASVAGAGLTWTIAAATLRRFLGRSLAFHRTEKVAAQQGHVAAALQEQLFSWWVEALFGSVNALCGLLVILRYGFSNHEAVTWGVCLLLLAIPSACRGYLSVVRQLDARRVASTVELTGFPAT